MKKIIVGVLMALALTACGAKKVLVTEYKYQTVDVPQEFFTGCVNENLIRSFPETPVTLGSEASMITVDLYRIAKACQLSNQATQEFLTRAKIIIESENDPKTIREKLAKLATDVKSKFKL